ncbi:hypothetical protein LCGC14_0472160 [marine sediment metagenome]|uniref:Deoxynucleotide monophosphate kinase n=1 Tax=marine sediment metagenome TaxID=412755 RepID=A0A0F9SH72_9ZZZZ
MILIGIGGKARAGKDTVARYLVSEHGLYHASFARRLKQVTQVKFGLLDEECSKKNYSKVIERWGISFRKMLQLEGTEAGWQLYDRHMSPGPSLWVRHIAHEWMIVQGSENFQGMVLSDMRFQHELDWIKSQGGFGWKVLRPEADGDVGIKGHASETWEFEADVEILNNATIPDLFARTERQMRKVLQGNGVLRSHAD